LNLLFNEGGATKQDLKSAVSELKHDLKYLKNDLFIKLCGIIIAVTLGLAGLMAHGFHWI
jgi:hypothetical protein